MTNRETLRSLAERVEALSGPDATVAKDIYRALFPVPELSPESHGYGWREDASGWWCQTGEDQRVPRQRIDPPNWLGSIDSAMSLVPEGLTDLSLNQSADASQALIFRDGDGVVGRGDATGGGAIDRSALALTAASLRAIGEGL